MPARPNAASVPQDKLRKVCMVGCFPPPLHGMAAVNAAVRERLTADHVDLLLINVAATGLRRDIWTRIRRVYPVLRGLLHLLMARQLMHCTLYMSISAELGQVYECLFLLIARSRKLHVVLHHHNFAYLDRHSRLTSVLMRLAGARAVHIVLSDGMGRRLMSTYACGTSPLVMSNAALLLARSRPGGRERVQLQTLGFLGNLSAEKGVFTFLDVCEAISSVGLPLRARLAGPFQDRRTEQNVRQRLAGLPMVEYVGAKYGDVKRDFYRELDVLLFPTRYVNEAEPLVVLEALQQGLPVIAYGRGAIPELLDASCGVVVPPASDFLTVAVEALNAWRTDPVGLARTSRAASARFSEIQCRAGRAWGHLEAGLLGRGGA